MFDYKQRSNLKDCIINDITSHDWKDIFCKDKNGNIQDFFIDEDTANAALDSLEAALTVDKVALSKIKSVDETSELTEADMLEDGTLVVYAN